MAKQTWRERAASVWLVGALSRATPKIYLAAFYEFLHLIIWSFLPFYFGGLVLYIVGAGTDYLALSVGTARNGELLVFTISMLAPTLYLVNHDPSGAGPFPHKLPFSSIGVLVLIFCGGVFALLKAGTVKNAAFVFQLSVCLTILALVFRYMAMVYHRVRMPEIPSESDLLAEERAFVKDMKASVGELT